MNLNRNLAFLLAAVVIGLYSTGIAAATAEEGPIIMRLAERGNEGAQVLLAGMYHRGEGGVTRNESQGRGKNKLSRIHYLLLVRIVKILTMTNARKIQM